VKRLRVTVCRGPECGIFTAEITTALRDRIAELGIGDRVVLDHKSCFGRCRSGPNLVISEIDEINESRPTGSRLGLATMPGGPRATMYNHMTPDQAVRVLETHALRLLR
jgi:(2Fe-2S) ferredoxin